MISVGRWLYGLPEQGLHIPGTQGRKKKKSKSSAKDSYVKKACILHVLKGLHCSHCWSWQGVEITCAAEGWNLP